jgi:hypothetical protein
MTTQEAKRWVQEYFRDFDEQQSDELYAVVEELCGCFDPLPASLREEYAGAETYHDLWFEVLTDHIIENDDPTEWLPRLYPLYVKDQSARGEAPPSKEGFSQWLAEMVDEGAVEQCLQSWPPA